MRHGEVWAIDLPQTGGREKSGRRPTAVVQKEGGDNTPIIAVVPFTSRLEALKCDNTVQIEPTRENGLAVTSGALVFQITSVDRVRFKSRLGKMSAEDFAKIEASVRNRLGL